ncbi:PadR family transcriptional regulator [Streptomyces antibioticus]|uniref:PadR family transcriptional regulator n=1 Tax=Streptomyces antibioticus TaxID=1890 RepID=UPI003D716032
MTDVRDRHHPHSGLLQGVRAVERAATAALEVDPPTGSPVGISRMTGAEPRRSPTARDITDENRWFTVLAFLRHLDDPAAQAAVLRRRLAFLQEPTSFFYDGDRPLRAEKPDDPFRRGVLAIARATSRAELDWLHDTLTSLGD